MTEKNGLELSSMLSEEQREILTKLIQQGQLKIGTTTSEMLPPEPENLWKKNELCISSDKLMIVTNPSDIEKFNELDVPLDSITIGSDSRITLRANPIPSKRDLILQYTGNKPFISIAGTIGAGKSELAKALAFELGLPLFNEPVMDSQYLKEFYGDMEKHGFPFQVHLYQQRYQQQLEILHRGQGGVQDRTIYEDMIFAKSLTKQGKISERNLDIYQNLTKTFGKSLPKPDIIIYLDVSPSVALSRIKERGRSIEDGITLDYMEDLHQEYENFIETFGLTTPILCIDWNNFSTTDAVIQKIVTFCRMPKVSRIV